MARLLEGMLMLHPHSTIHIRQLAGPTFLWMTPNLNFPSLTPEPPSEESAQQVSCFKFQDLTHGLQQVCPKNINKSL